MRLVRVCWLLALSALPMVASAQAFTQPGPVPVAAPWSLQAPDGKTVDFPQDAQQRPTVLLFWPSWCPYSRALQPYVQDIWNDYRAVGVNVWTINILESGDPLKAMKERGLSFPLLLNGDALRQTYRIDRTPWLVVIDGDSRIVYTRPPEAPTPVEVARDARKALNVLLGARAIAVPSSYPPPYDLHLKTAVDRPDRSAPTTISESQWVAWVDQYLAAIPAGESEPDLAARGALTDGKSALAAAKAVWTERYGAEELRRQAPYRAFRRANRWVVLGQGLDRKLGEGLIAVLDVETGKALRVTHGHPVLD